MTKFWKCVLVLTAVLSGLSLGGTVYAVKIWPAKVQAQAEANAKADVRLQQERELIAQENARLDQRERMLKLEVDRLQAQQKLADSNHEVAKATIQLAEAVRAERERYDREGLVRP